MQKQGILCTCETRVDLTRATRRHQAHGQVSPTHNAQGDQWPAQESHRIATYGDQREVSHMTSSGQVRKGRCMMTHQGGWRHITQGRVGGGSGHDRMDPGPQHTSGRTGHDMMTPWVRHGRWRHMRGHIRSWSSRSHRWVRRQVRDMIRHIWSENANFSQ